ncbi:MAG: hypothetical protein NY202_02590 [Mollicutes bacterium UO1]
MAKEGMGVANNIGDNVTKVTETVVTNVADKGEKLITKGMDTGADVYKTTITTVSDATDKFQQKVENVTTTAMNNTASVLNKGLDVAGESVKVGFGAEVGMVKFGVGLGQDKAIAKELEIKNQIIKQLEDDKKDLVAKVDELSNQLQEQSKAGQGNLMSVIEMITNKK